MTSTNNRTDGPLDVQVFELTMDNDDEQDELNRRLRKPGEPGYCPPPKTPSAKSPSGDGSQQPTTESTRQ